MSMTIKTNYTNIGHTGQTLIMTRLPLLQFEDIYIYIIIITTTTVAIGIDWNSCRKLCSVSAAANLSNYMEISATKANIKLL